MDDVLFHIRPEPIYVRFISQPLHTLRTERIVTILMMLAGVFGFGVVMGSISQIIDERNNLGC